MNPGFCVCYMDPEGCGDFQKAPQSLLPCAVLLLPHKKGSSVSPPHESELAPRLTEPSRSDPPPLSPFGVFLLRAGPSSCEGTLAATKRGPRKRAEVPFHGCQGRSCGASHHHTPRPSRHHAEPPEGKHSPRLCHRAGLWVTAALCCVSSAECSIANALQ